MNVNNLIFPISIVNNRVGCLSEWLRSKTRNLLGNSRVGSNPAAVEKNRKGESPKTFLEKKGRGGRREREILEFHILFLSYP